MTALTEAQRRTVFDKILHLIDRENGVGCIFRNEKYTRPHFPDRRALPGGRSSPTTSPGHG